jgi:hypothetical protein
MEKKKPRASIEDGKEKKARRAQEMGEEKEKDKQ